MHSRVIKLHMHAEISDDHSSYAWYDAQTRMDWYGFTLLIGVSPVAGNSHQLMESVIITLSKGMQFSC